MMWTRRNRGILSPLVSDGSLMNRLPAALLVPVLILTAVAAEAAPVKKAQAAKPAVKSAAKSPAKPVGDAAPKPAAPKFDPVAVDRTKTRIFMPLRNAKITKRQSRVTGWSLEATSDTPNAFSMDRAVGMGALHHVAIQNFENKTFIRVDWRYAAPVEVEARPGGLEIIFHHQKATPYFRAVAPGVRLWEGQRWTSAGPMRVRALQLDPKRVKLIPALASAGPKSMGLTKVSNMARWHGALAAVNGSFFSPATGEPQGTLVVDRQLISRTMLDRPSVWFDKLGSADIRVDKSIPTVLLDDGTGIRCQAVNEIPRRNRVTMFTGHYGPRTRTITDPSRWEIAVNAGGRVVGEGRGNIQIPRGGYVLSGQGSGCNVLKKYIGYGQELRLDPNLPANVQHALGGGPTLIQDGRVKVLASQQHFKADIARGRAPRTAFGMTKDNKYLLLTVDGHKPGYSMGATLTELAWVLRELGAVDALNLDGGGSTTMWLRGRTLGQPSDGQERPVSTALLVVPRGADTAAAPLDLTKLLASFAQ